MIYNPSNSIFGFRGEHFFLSNFYPSPVSMDDKDLGPLTFPTVEHLFQYAKATSIADRNAIRLAGTPGEAKRVGRKIKLNPDWEDGKDSWMLTCITLKFSQHSSPLGALLVNTGNTPLVEANTWGDRYWGVDIATGTGGNKLGKILMQVRADMQKSHGIGYDLAIPNARTQEAMTELESGKGTTVNLDDLFR